MTDYNVIRMTGFLMYPHVYEPDTAFGASNWKVTFFPEDKAQWKIFKDSGIQKKVNNNTDPKDNRPIGDYFSLTRGTQKIFKNELLFFTGPVIEDAEGNVIVDYIWKSSQKRAFAYKAEQKDEIERRGNPVLLGNGSKVEVDVTTFPTIKGIGHRLNSVRVLELVEYKGSEGPLPPMSKVEW